MSIVNKKQRTVVVETGVYRDIQSLVKALEEDGVFIEKDVRYSLFNSGVHLSGDEKSSDLVILPSSELEFWEKADNESIRTVAVKNGLEQCPVEVAFYLRLKLRRQSPGEYLVVVTDPLKDSGGEEFLPVVCNDRLAGRMLSSNPLQIDIHPEVFLVFVQPKN